MEAFKHHFKFKINDTAKVCFYDDDGTLIDFTGIITAKKFYNKYLKLHPAYFVESENIQRWVFEHNLNSKTQPIKPIIKTTGKWEKEFI